MKRNRICVIAVLFILYAVYVPTLNARHDEGNSTYHSLRANGSVHGMVRDGETNETIALAAVRIKDTGRYRISRDDGSFYFDNLPAGRYTILVQHLGYKTAEKQLLISDGDTNVIEIFLFPSIFHLSETIVITGTGRERGISETYQPTNVVGGMELQRRVRATIPASLLHLPGISQQSFGGAAAQPVIRGMGGDRVLMLEDGLRTGDLSTTAADHAVAIDPVVSERIEVVKGPASLLYGSNALGGVINVIRNEIPSDLPQRINGSAVIRGDSYNRGVAGGGVLTIPAGNLAIRTEISGRKSGDIRTPEGELPSTSTEGITAGIGTSFVGNRGYIGGSLSYYELGYGVPGEFNGMQIPGAHYGGVTIEMKRITGRLKGIYYGGIGPFRDFELNANITNYYHKEIEGMTVSGRPIIGTEFDQLSFTAGFAARHVHDNGDIRSEGAFGISFRYRDLLTAGGFSGTRSASETVGSVYIFEEFAVGYVRFQAGLRYDYTKIEPKNTAPIRSGERLIPVRSREFHSVSGSAALLYDFSRSWKAGINLARAFRTPAVEELYSDGPHLADFSYDIGNPELSAETGHGIDLFLRGETSRLKTEINFFVNAIGNYIYYNPTGELDQRFRRYPVFQAESDDAIFRGAESRIEWRFNRAFVFDLTFSYVHASRSSDGDPLPFIPPMNGSLQIRYEGEKIFGYGGWTGAASQNRVPSALFDPTGDHSLLIPQTSTTGYNLLNAGIGYRWTGNNVLHTVIISVENATDAVWRDHLSRVKEIAPQPGRNIQFSYQIFF